jgi:hypothetical protein
VSRADALRPHLLVAVLLAGLTVVVGCAAALAATGIVAAAIDDGSFLSGLLEGLVAGASVLVLTAVAAVAVLRAWVGRHGRPVLRWRWSVLAVVAGVAAAWPVAYAGGEVGGGGQTLLTVVSLPAGMLGTYAVLLIWSR